MHACMYVDFSTHPHTFPPPPLPLTKQQPPVTLTQPSAPISPHIQAASTAAYTELTAIVRAWVKQFLDSLRRLLRLNLTVIAQGMCVASCVFLCNAASIHTNSCLLSVVYSFVCACVVCVEPLPDIRLDLTVIAQRRVRIVRVVSYTCQSVPSTDQRYTIVTETTPLSAHTPPHSNKHTQSCNAGMRAGKYHQGQHFPLSMLQQLLSPESGLRRVHTCVCVLCICGSIFMHAMRTPVCSVLLC